jgi:hypothetical protein
LIRKDIHRFSRAGIVGRETLSQSAASSLFTLISAACPDQQPVIDCSLSRARPASEETSSAKIGMRSVPALERLLKHHCRRLNAAIHGPCPVQETARAIIGIEEIRDNLEHNGLGSRTPPDEQALSPDEPALSPDEPALGSVSVAP